MKAGAMIHSHVEIEKYTVMKPKRVGLTRRFLDSVGLHDVEVQGFWKWFIGGSVVGAIAFYVGFWILYLFLSSIENVIR